MATLTQIIRYPLKSTRGEALTECVLEPAGLPLDRHWMVAAPDGRMITGRTHPELVRVRAHCDGHTLSLSAPGRADLQVALTAFTRPAAATVWQDRFSAWCGATAADAWLSAWLGLPVQLLYIGTQSQRPLASHPEVGLSFADAYPLLLLTTASLAALNARAGRPFTAAHFRPNLVIDGTDAFAEDHWRTIRIGSAVLAVEKPCERCVFTTVDPDSGVKSPLQEPLRTLAKFRTTPGGVMFGQNLRVITPGRIAVGMAVEVIGEPGNLGVST